MERIINAPIEVIAGIVIAVVVKLKSSITLGWFGAGTTIVVATLSGLFLYEPVTQIIGLDQKFEVFIAIILSLIGEGVCKGLLDLSSKPGGLGKIITAILTRDPRFLDDDKPDVK